MRAALACLCAVALVAGCGGDDEETTVVETTTVPTVETVPETVPEPTVPVEPGDDEPADPEAPANGHGGAEAPDDCGRVTFEENTDSGAFEITAVGTDCATARAVARAARNSTSQLSYEARGFQCTGGHSEEQGLSSIEWFCFGADREVVTFATS